MLVSVFSKVLLISITASLLIVLILTAKALFKEKLSARWHYYIWLLLLIRLLIPYTPEFSLNLNLKDFIPVAQNDTRVQTEDYQKVRTDNTTDFNYMENERVESKGYNTGKSLAINEKNEPIEIKHENSKLLTISISIASKIWLAGMIFFVFYVLVINCIMNYRIRKTSVFTEDGNIREILEYCKKLLNIKKDIPIIYQKHIKTPALCGVFQAKMLIPVKILDQLDASEIKYVFLHELCHYKRKDTMIGMFKMLLCILHWFNPLIWYALYKMKEDMEPVCDELVLSCIKSDERRNYAETLIKILKYFSESRWVYSTANMSQGSINNMEWRLKLMNVLKKRSVIFGIVIALVTITIGVVGVLFINKYLNFTLLVNAAEANPVNTVDKSPVAANMDGLKSRGKILDRNGNELAFSIPADIIATNPKEIKASGQDSDYFAKTLADFLSLEKGKVLEKVTVSSTYEIIRKKVDKGISDKIKEWVKNNNIKGIIIEEDSKRVYPNNNLAAHVVGFTDEENQGLVGIEQSMGQYLKLKDTNITLTIDIGIQSIVENALDKAIKDYNVVNGAVALVMAPKSGEILAMSSKPDFNLNEPYSPPSGVHSGTWKGKTQEDIKILEDTVWRNKNLADTLQPGSIFRAITSAMALEDGIIRTGSIVNDSSVTINNSTINCWRRGRLHGEESFREAVYNSCNPVFVRLAQSLGIDKFYTYVRNFGFYDRTGLELPDEANSVINENPDELNMAPASIGQGFQVTPIQLATAYCAIANDGKLMKPQIIKKLTENNNDKIFEPKLLGTVISKETSEIMKELLEGTVSKGTAANAYVEGYKIAGCLGTSEKAFGKFIASFAGFAPAANPEIVCIILLDEPSGELFMAGMTAAPIAGEVMRDVLDYMKVKND